MRPVVDMHFVDFITVAMDEVVNQMAKIRYMFGGQCTVPVVLRALTVPPVQLPPSTLKVLNPGLFTFRALKWLSRQTQPMLKDY